MSRESRFIDPAKSGTSLLEIEYQEVNGAQLPKSINTKGTTKYTSPIGKPDLNYDFQFKLDQCSVTRE